MMSAPDLRQAYAQRARDAVKHLSVDILGESWLDLLRRVRADG